MIEQQFSSSFSAQTITGYSSAWGALVGAYVRVDTPNLLAALVLTFRWTDSSGAQSRVVSIGLGASGLTAPIMFPMFAAANELLTVEGVLTGSATFTLQVGLAVF